jgi:uncharacterized protein Yka (UPF0111/DUF47 family)
VAFFRLIPREEKFFSDFVAIGAELARGAALLEEMLAPEHPLWDRADAIKEVEHRCDALAKDVLQRLYRTFVTPIDREDIYALNGVLDDVIDDIEASASVLRLYRIERVRPAARELARLISACVEQVNRGLVALEARKGVSECVQELGRLEAEADGVYLNAVGALFEEERDPIAVIKWKEILDLLEAATDRCKEVATLLEGVVVKHA